MCCENKKMVLPRLSLDLGQAPKKVPKNEVALEGASSECWLVKIAVSVLTALHFDTLAVKHCTPDTSNTSNTSNTSDTVGIGGRCSTPDVLGNGGYSPLPHPGSTTSEL